MEFPVALAVAQSLPELPLGPYSYEPKYDGWRAAMHVARGRMHSRSGTDLTHRFPEVADAADKIGDLVLDGELVAVRGQPPRLDFAALQTGPSRRRAQGVSVYLMAFDLLACDGTDLRGQPYHHRRGLLQQQLQTRGGGRIQLAPATTDPATAQEWMDPAYGAVGIEGVVSKSFEGRYQGRRSGWWKTRVTTTEEAVILGVTAHAVVLGRPDHRGRWKAVGLSQPLSTALRRELADRLHALGDPETLPGIIAGLPGSDDVTYQPTQPKLVIEIRVDSALEFGRYRHQPVAVRLREDRGPGDLSSFTDH